MLYALLLIPLLIVLLAIAQRLTAHRLDLPFGATFGDAGSVDTFIPEVWSKELLSSLKKALVIAAPGVVNTDYEGEIAEAGDTVHINSVGRPTIRPYVPGQTKIVPEKLTTAQRALVVDQSNYFAFEIDDVDKRQAQGGLMEEGTLEAGYGLRDVADQYVESVIRSGVAPANALGAVSLTQPEYVYDKLLIPLSVLLDEADVPTEDRYAILPPWCHGLLQRDDRFIDFSKSNRAEQAMGNGIIGEAAGFLLRKSNNLPVVTGDDHSVIAGHPMGASYAEQINKTEAYRPEDSFSDAVKGLHLFGAKVVRPTCIATALASKS